MPWELNLQQIFNKSSTSTDAVYSEMGRISVQSYHHVNILKVYLCLSNFLSYAYYALVDQAMNELRVISKRRNLNGYFEVPMALGILERHGDQ